MREQLTCQVCKVPLEGKLDTYGEQGEERCFHCHFDTRLTKLPILYHEQDEALWDFEQVNEDFKRSMDSANFRLKYAFERQDAATVKAIQKEIHRYEVQFEPYRRAYYPVLDAYEKAIWWEQWWRENAVRR